MTRKFNWRAILQEAIAKTYDASISEAEFDAFVEEFTRKLNERLDNAKTCKSRTLH